MATVKAFLRTTKKDKECNIRFRYTDGRDTQAFHKSDILIKDSLFDTKKECVKAKVLFDSDKRNELDQAIAGRKTLIMDICLNADKSLITTEWLEAEIDKRINPGNYEQPKQTFFDIFEEFLSRHKLSVLRKRHYDVVARALKRYELHKGVVLNLEEITPDTIRDVEKYLSFEHTLFETHPNIFKEVEESRTPKPRGQNTINGMLTKLRTFLLWCNDNDKTSNNPFKKFSIDECTYGTPVYITIEERNTIYQTDLSNSPQLERQRDIFVFQSCIGCRVSDMYGFTEDNIINGAIEYVARKTKDERPVTVRVPLNAIARAILDKYKDCNTFLPFINQPDYNEAIRAIFMVSGITRPVTVIDSLTRESKVVPINTVASSHMARRTFVGNLYKKVKDPNLVGSMSGHKQGSTAFARYRDIDDDMKRELVAMLE